MEMLGSGCMPGADQLGKRETLKDPHPHSFLLSRTMPGSQDEEMRQTDFGFQTRREENELF